MFAKRLITQLVFTPLIVSALLFSNLGITPVYAANIIVNTPGDEFTANGLCSLREAIINANNDDDTYPDCTTGSGSDTITFAGNYTITLVIGQLPQVTSEIVIKGNGVANTIIQANASPDTATFRVFEVGSFGVGSFGVGSNAGNLTLDSLTVRHGRCVGECEHAVNHGGGIFNYKGILTLTNSTIAENSALSGGGIHNYSSTMIVINSTLSGNSAENSGGGIENRYSSVTITNSTFSENSTGEDALECGGGIYNYESPLIVTNSFFSGNSASYGGGVCNVYNNTSTVTSTGFLGNSASTDGGGIYNTSAILNVIDSTISENNVSLGNGAGIYNLGTLTVTNSTLSINSTPYGGGGGIYNGGSLSIWSSTLNGNSADRGGGIYNSNTGAMGIVNSTLSDNEAYEYGGGIYNEGSDARIYNSTIAFNTSGVAGIYAALSSTVTLHNTIVAGNTVSPGIFRDCNGKIQSWGRNLFSDTTNCTINVASGSYGLYSPLSSLGPLQDNGGPTWTHALLSTSTAIDTGDNTICANWPIFNIDQRGVARPQGSHCDIGAYESLPTFTSTAEQDGWILETSETSGRGGSKNNTAATIRLGDNTTNKQYRSILSFDTSAIPEGATINKVTLKVKKARAKGGGNPVNLFKGFMIDVNNGDFGAPNLELGDFKAAGNQMLGPVRPPLVNGWYSLDLTAANLQINTTGNTQIRLRFKLDDNNNFVANYLMLYSANAELTNQPLLIVEYTVP